MSQGDDPKNISDSGTGGGRGTPGETEKGWSENFYLNQAGPVFQKSKV